MKKKLIIISFILFLILIFLLLGRRNEVIETLLVSRGEVKEEIFESGVVKKGEEINLSFRLGGRIKDIYANEGSRVNKNDLLVKIDDSDLLIQIEKAQASLRIAELDFDKIKTGTAQQNISIFETALKNARSNFSFAELNLKDTEKIVDAKMTGLYNDAFIVVNNSAVQMEAVSNIINEISRKYFTGFWIPKTGTGININTSIKNRFEEIKKQSDILKENPSSEEVIKSLEITEKHLKDTSTDLVTFLNLFDDPIYNNISKIDSDLLFSQREIVNKMISSVSSIRNSIITSTLSNTHEINLAKSKLSSTKGILNQAENEFLMVQAARQENVKQVEARIKQAKAEVDLLKQSLEETSIRAPFDGVVLRNYYQPNEVVQFGIPVISILPDDDYYIEVNVYEGDIARVKIGNSVEIEIVAFPNKIILGEVTFIDGAPLIIDGVVYYKLLISMKEFPEGMFSGMTADITITVNKKENVLYIPEIILERGISKFNFFVLKNGKQEKREVEIGLRGTNEKVEILSGLEEGDIIVQ